MDYCDKFFLLQCKDEKEVFLRRLKEKTYEYSWMNFYYRDVFLSRTEGDGFLLSSTGLLKRGRSHVFKGRIEGSLEGIRIHGTFGTPLYFRYYMKVLTVILWIYILAGCADGDWYAVCFSILWGIMASCCLIILPDKLPWVSDRRRIIAFMEDVLGCRWMQTEEMPQREPVKRLAGKEIVIWTQKSRDEIEKGLLKAPHLHSLFFFGQGKPPEAAVSLKKKSIILGVYCGWVHPGIAKVFYGKIKETDTGTVIRGYFGVRKGCLFLMYSVLILGLTPFIYYEMYLQALFAVSIVVFINLVMRNLKVEDKIIRYLMELLTDRENTPFLEIRTWQRLPWPKSRKEEK